jgi:subtilisin family serine protease
MFRHPLRLATLAVGLAALLASGANSSDKARPLDRSGEARPQDSAAETGTRRLTMSPLDLERVEQFTAVSPAAVPDHVSLAVEGDALYIPLQIEFKDVESRQRFRAPESVTVYHEFDRFADAFLDVRSRHGLEDVQAMEGVVWIDADMETVRVPPPPKAPPSLEKARAAERIVRGGIEGVTGKGVIVAVIDDGIDFRHKDFLTLDHDGQPVSRLLYYWDTFARPVDGGPGRPAPIAYPNGTPIGVIYSREDLTAEVRHPTGRIAIAGRHGTPCTGVAAGNGSARADKRFIGVAPEADLIAVRIGSSGPWQQFLLGAVCAWIDEKAGKQPVVISCSFGHPQQGGRDGCRVTERQLDARFRADRQARAICIAAGNEARFGEGRGYHAEATFQGEEAKGMLAWDCPPGTSGRVTVYVQTDTPENVSLKCTALPTPEVHRYLHPLSGALVIEVGLSDATRLVARRTGQLELWSNDRKKLHADAYLDTEPWMEGTFRSSGLSRTGLLRTPGTMTNAITVGSYDFNAVDDRFDPVRPLASFDGRPMKLGDLSSYSSPGYNRNGVVKPLIVSPGQWHITAEAGGQDGQSYTQFNGTSAATPYTAGIVALMMEKKPTLTFGEIKALLRANATTNDITGRTPNPEWGYGRLDYRAVQAIFKSLR